MTSYKKKKKHKESEEDSDIPVVGTPEEDLEDTDPTITQHLRYYDRFHNELPDVIELDPHQDNGEPNGKRVNPRTGEVELCYYKDCMVVIDGIVDPPQETVLALRQLHRMQHFSKLPIEERHAMVKGVAGEIRRLNLLESANPPGFIVATCPKCQHTFNVDQ